MSEEEIFHRALAARGPQERAAYLDQACAGDPALRASVEALLRANVDASGFLSMPVLGGAATVDQPVGDRPGTVIGSYKLLEQIGEGGFGVVFMAEQQQPVRRKVALKVVKPGMDTRQVVARFEAERQALALMDHPNIARVFDGGTAPSGRPYFVMELVKGIPITDFCDQNALPIRERLELFVSTCQAVQHAHQKGIIHRDLKPSNVLVTMHDTTPVVKVIDFGIAKATGQQLTDKTLFTNFAQLLGTPLYMSPEQAQMSGLDVDTRSDVYSLGVLLYELLTGTTPFDKERLKAAGYDEIRRIIREEEPQKPSTRISTLGQVALTVSTQRMIEPRRLSQLCRGDLDWMVMKALEKDRNRRYQTASSFAQDVQRYLADEPVQACPPSAWYRFRKFARRNKGVLATTSALAVAVLVVVGVVAGSLGWMARDRSMRQAKLNLEIEHALEEAARARDLALTLTDDPHHWKAALAEAESDLKRAQGLAAQDETALESANRERLQALQAMLEADESDRRFAARFEQVRLEQTEVHMARSEFKAEVAFTALKEALQRHYRILLGATPVEGAVAILQQRPKAMQELLLAALEVCLDTVPQKEPQTRKWLGTVLDAADTGPWRKRARQALQAGNWKALEQVIDEAATARQPPSLLIGLARKTPRDHPACLAVSRRIQRAYPGDFWANHELANYLQYRQHPQFEEAIRYYTAALALRPGNPAACVNLGNALLARGDRDGAIRAYRDALDGHPNYAAAHERLGLALLDKGDLDGAIDELRQMVRYRNRVWDHVVLGDALRQKGLHNEASASYRKAITGYRQALARNPKDGLALNNLAWLLVTCANRKLWNPAEAVPLARRAVALQPGNGTYWNTLGAVHYRAGNWKEAAAALAKAMPLRNGGDSLDWFFLAMAHWQLGDQAQARTWFDRAVQWMDKNLPKNDELRRIRVEAAALLKPERKKN